MGNILADYQLPLSLPLSPPLSQLPLSPPPLSHPPLSLLPLSQLLLLLSLLLVPLLLDQPGPTKNQELDELLELVLDVLLVEPPEGEENPRRARIKARNAMMNRGTARQNLSIV